MDSINYKYLYSGIIFIISSYTDYLDGKLAREKNIITNFGKIIDPLADKILISSILICFLNLRIVSALLVILMISREFIIISLRCLIILNGGKVVSANILGKLKTISQMITLIYIFLVGIFLEFNLIQGCYNLNLIKDILLWISTFFSILSGLIYIKSNKKYIASNL